MTSAEATFHIDDTVVYAMQGIGRIKNIVTRTTEGRPRGFYQVGLEKNKGEVLVPVDGAAALGLRHTLSASEVPQVLQRLQQAASQPVLRGQSETHYLWCKQRLRQGQALGLAEVRRFLHDLDGWRVPRTSVYVSSAPACTPSCPRKLPRRWDAR